MITIETINGKKYTVVWHVNMSDNYKRRELTWMPLKNGCLINHLWGITLEATHIATALSALPRQPKPEDAPLLYLYMSEGIAIAMKWGKSVSAIFCHQRQLDEHYDDENAEICDAYFRPDYKENGNPCEIAIEEVI